MKITTLPVYSKLADEREVRDLGLWEKLPNADSSRWQLSQHQVDTYRALTEGDYDVIFNTAMTGDGKSLAAYLPVLTKDHHALGMYPTNELLKDQQKQFGGYCEKFGLVPSDIPTYPLWGEKLSEFQAKYEYRTRGDALHNIFNNNNVILTNPDIFNLVMSDSYFSLMYNKQELPYSLCTNFNYFIFDEFHIFSTPQIVSVLTAMVYISNQTKMPRKFLFSSATPVETLQVMARRGNLRFKEIGGSYHSEPDPNYRQVLYFATLNIHNLPQDVNAETWIVEHLDEIISFWKACDGKAKGAIIVNSVASARRITLWLTEKLKQHNISVGENTGITDRERRKDALENKDIVVGTSTIDVGVDFNINFLVFETTNGGTFLQRLGRLGRVKQNLAPFPKYEAHALLSGKTPWVYEKLIENLSSSGVKDGSEIERSVVLRDAVANAFPQENEFVGYTKRWGIVQPAHVVNVLRGKENGGAYESLIEALDRHYSVVFDTPLSKGISRFWAVTKYQERGKKVLEEILAFRGSSPFHVACLDVSVQPPTFLTYDLFSLLQSAEYETMKKDDYCQAVEKHIPENNRATVFEGLKYTIGGESETPIILKILRFNREREKLVLKLEDEAKRYTDRVSVVKGFSIFEPPSQAEINRTLRRQYFVCYITVVDAKQLRWKLHLPAFFQLYRLKDMRGNREYTVTFGKNALLLDSVMLHYRNKSVEDEAIII